jgi:hypothetical protein
VNRQRHAIRQLSPTIPDNAREEALRKIIAGYYQFHAVNAAVQETGAPAAWAPLLAGRAVGSVIAAPAWCGGSDPECA